MLHRRSVFIYLFILFGGIYAQRYNPDNDNEKDYETDPVSDIRRQAFLPQVQAPSNNDNSQNRIPSGNAGIDRKPFVSASRSPSTLLAGSVECKSDVQKYCGRGSQQIISNLKVLQCVDDLDNAIHLISKECQHLIYNFKYNMTHDARFDDAAMKQCAKDVKLLDACNDLTDDRGSGRLASCLYDSLANITEPGCRYFINQMQSVVFNDWRLTEYFSTACMPDITKLECGRLDDDNQALPNEPGAVVSCLSQKYKELSGVCRKEIFRLAEMQSDDYHLDRALFYACRDDRERLCSQVSSGNGQVYRCLYDQKFNIMMSSDCRKEVHRRQSLVVANVNVDAPLMRACRSEIRKHKCSIDPKDNDKRSSLVKLLLCLQDTLKKGYYIQDDCRREMLVHRRMLMSDYALSPEIVSECKIEMVQYCPSLFQQGANASIGQRGGRMIHCLLSAAHKEKAFSVQCLSVIKSLIRAVDPGDDIRADPLLETSCRPVIDTLCPRIKPGDSNVIMCLLDNLKNVRMTEECEDRLMEVAYFMARDWRLTPRLLHSCRTNLVNLCQLPKDWSMNEEVADIQVGTYLGCLYQQRQQLERECRSELKRLMNIRVQNIGLMPEIEDNCIIDLATCKNLEVKGEELKCLQRKYNKLEDRCKGAVRNLTQITMSDPTLDFLLMKACEPMIQSFCLDVEDGRENDLIRCLIKHKNEYKIDFRCKSGLDHYQITSLKDEAFLSQQFRRKCSREIDEHCAAKRTKAIVIECLADLMIRDVLKRENKVTEECRDELKFELLQRSENIDLDPSLARACRKDIRIFCADRTPGNAQILDCLKENHEKVSAACYPRLRKREKLDVILPENDYSLMSKCASVIQKFCAYENKQNILSCLRRNSNQDAMPNLCRRVLYHRLMILNTDARFNKGLIDNCQKDITAHCSSVVVDDDDKDSDEDDKGNDKDDNDGKADEDTPDVPEDVSDREMGGRIIECLRSKYTQTAITLDYQCVTELVDVIQTSKLDVKLDIRLYQSCRDILNKECTGIEQEDCLKLLYQQSKLSDGDCKEQVRRIIREGQADIHVDRALAFACQADVLKYCNDIPIGNGKQLQCLINKGKSVTSQCQHMLQQRRKLWEPIPIVNDVAELTETIEKSGNNTYPFSVILLILCVLCLWLVMFAVRRYDRIVLEDINKRRKLIII